MENTTFASGRYVLREPLGAGGMATVYRAEDTRLGVERAIKVLRGDYVRSQSIQARFEREARVMARLEHPHVVPVHDIAREGDQVYLVMSLLSAGSLQDHLDRYGALTPRIAVQAVVGVLAAVQAAHQLGIVHRDIKPHNVLVDAQGAPRLTDFGIAHDAEDRSITKTGALMGTWSYMAPEQRAGHRVDTRADIYAVGCLLAALLTADEPHDLHNREAHMKQLEGLPPALRTFVERCTRYHPQDRFPSAAAAREILMQIHDTLPLDREDARRLGGHRNPPAAFTPEETGTHDTLLAFLEEDSSLLSSLESTQQPEPSSSGSTRVPVPEEATVLREDARTVITTEPPDDTELLQPEALLPREPSVPPPPPRLPAEASLPPQGSRWLAALLVGAGALAVVVVGLIGITQLGPRTVPTAPGNEAVEAVVPEPEPAELSEPVVPEPAEELSPAPEPAVPPVAPQPVAPQPVAPQPVAPKPQGVPTPALEPQVAPEPVVEPAPAEPEPSLPRIPLKISSAPWGAEARIDGKRVGVTPLTVQLPAGSYAVEVQDDQGRRGYRRVELDAEPDSFCWDFAANLVCR